MTASTFMTVTDASSSHPRFQYLEILNTPSDQLLEVLNHNIIGTPGHGMLYQHLGVNDKIYRIENPLYVNLKHAGTIVGTCCFCKRTTHNSSLGDLSSYYVRYFSFRHQYRRKAPRKATTTRRSLLREEIRSVIDGPALGSPPGEKFFHYACVDPRNVRSVALCQEFGFQTVRDYATLVFSRMNPKPGDCVVERVEQGEEDIVRSRLTYYYRDYNMVSTENLFNGRDYWVVKNK
ncbi:MAG TPA: hypothetical protein VEB86_06510, partial [Chryseosolibacter sp.]|nr:hypothetical protein [Chryseosolibacter sp.]